MTPIAGVLVLLFGLHLLGVLIKLTFRAGMVIGVLLVALGLLSLLHHAPLFAGLDALHFFSLSMIGFFGPALARWLNRDVHFRSSAAQPGPWSGFLLGFAFAFGWTPCIGPILTTVLAFAAASDKIGRGVLLLAAYSAGLAVPFLLTALGISRFFKFYQSFRKYLHVVELLSGALLVFIGGLVFVNKLTWLTGKLGSLDSLVLWLEHVLTNGIAGPIFLAVVGLLVVVLIIFAVFREPKTFTSFPIHKAALVVGIVMAIIGATYFADKTTRKSTQPPSGPSSSQNDKSIGMLMPELTLKDLDGKDVSLSDYKGKVVLVNFWATWCIPCREEIPWLIEMQQMYNAKGFTVLGLSMDERPNPAISASNAAWLNVSVGSATAWHSLPTPGASVPAVQSKHVAHSTRVALEEEFVRYASSSNLRTCLCCSFEHGCRSATLRKLLMT